MPVGSSRPDANGCALPLTMARMAPSPALSGSPMTATYTRPSGPTATAVGFCSPVTSGFDGSAARATEAMLQAAKTGNARRDITEGLRFVNGCVIMADILWQHHFAGTSA